MFSTIIGWLSCCWGMVLLRRRRTLMVAALLLCSICWLIWYIKQLFLYELELTIVEPRQTPELSTSKHIFLLVLVLTTPSRSAKIQRQAIRETWGNPRGTNLKLKEEIIPWKVVFLLGNSKGHLAYANIKVESDKMKDILIGDFDDQYQNLLVKVMMGFNWAKDIDCSFVLKADDDVYVHLPKLINWLQQPSLPARLYAGEVVDGNRVIRFPWSKYFVNFRSFNESIYPPYCRGSFYALSRNILADLVHIATYHKAFPMEDAYVGLLTRSAGIKALEIEGCISSRYRYQQLKQWSRDKFRDLVCLGDNFDHSVLNITHSHFINLANGY